ncbi:peptide chain release factor N(5)-glutamine methyltransferase [Methylotenera mobilis]|uniref:peptide chain release factor N(5)-glutamine methyltransferase n=1 Tax=Methylotenera mobilis TaxID=359408 RepID=UPI0003652D92|nr:peptide chain release factor N(5)-glutamine methyltransferase [Methylotenera mobilis]PPC97640.1 MAG: peptide chain release factor N(5)-glutamine methyltransferase [Methylotenera sp.]
MTQTVRTTWAKAQHRLIKTLSLEGNEAKFEAQLLLQNVLNVNRAWLLAHESDALQDKIKADFESLLARRLLGEPIAYILGQREFFGLNLIVTPDTLIPRPDTETLVETALDKIPTDTPFTVLDLGTGTGAVALAIAEHRPEAQVTAIDASSGALDIAKRNANQLDLTQVDFRLSNWFSALEGERFNLIVSNPPYIEQHDIHLTQGDLRFEPMSALASGTDGLDDIRQIVDNCLLHLHPQGWLMLEHGYNQAHLVTDLMAQSGLIDITTIKDLGANDRVTIGKNPLIVSTHWD